MGFEVILPFLRPIEHLILDADVSEIMVNGSLRVFIERHGQIEEAQGVSIPERSLQVAVRNIARALGDEISEEKPLLDSRLPDGSRVAAVIPPCSVNGTTLTIRKFQTRLFTADELVRVGSMPARILATFRESIVRRENILISGGTGTGKTTMLNALAVFIGNDDRIILIEDTSEIAINKRNLVRFEARREQNGLPAVAIRDLLRATLRHPARSHHLGEVRGGKRLTCCRRSTPVTPVRFPPSTPTLPSKRWLGSPVAFSSPASSCPTRLFAAISAMRSICCCISNAVKAVAMFPNSSASGDLTLIPTRSGPRRFTAPNKGRSPWRKTPPRGSFVTTLSRRIDWLSSSSTSRPQRSPKGSREPSRSSRLTSRRGFALRTRGKRTSTALPMSSTHRRVDAPKTTFNPYVMCI